LVDKLHAKCGICDTVISLNKKFEIVHLVRHFNAWHPSTHKCAGTWPNKVLIYLLIEYLIYLGVEKGVFYLFSHKKQIN